jgi:DNA-binding NarL/FixJ family response regulator
MAEELQSLNEKVDILVRLLACALTTGRSQQECISILSKAGLQPKLIAELIGTTPNTVRVTLTNMRKKRRKKTAIGSS